jgi:hypothetical protein
VIQDNNLGQERFSFSGWFSVGFRGNISSFDFFDSNIFDIETNIVSWNSFSELFVMHFDGFNLSSFISGSEVSFDIGFENSGFDSSDGDCSNTSDFVNILEWKSEGFFCGSFGGVDLIKSLEKSGSRVPRGVGGFFNHIVSIKSRNGNEMNGVGFVSDFFQETGKFSLDFFISIFRVVHGFFINFVQTDDHLFDSQSEGEKSVFSGLSIFGNTSFEFSLGGSNHEHGAIGLRGSGNHVFDEISMSWGINNGNQVFFGFEFPESDINSDTSFSFGLKFIKNPGIFERSFTHFVGFFFEFFDNSFINSSTFVN